ncbi:glycosyltransferase family 4 protein [Krasilnikovia sp. MM14-A1259]|uniref:glycosyltransferase family 4 protein n=1 Tax=Krasilnikovia sp. MM14-A1259 TaxID=3373539 RepID=UPI0038147364
MRGAPPRVALVYDAVYPFQKGGGERRFHEIGRHLRGVELYGMRGWPGGGRSTMVDGVPVHGLCRARPLYTRQGRRSIPQAVIFGLACLKLLWKRFDVIDCCGFPYFSLFTCRFVATLRRKPLISTWHEVWGLAYWRTYLGRLGAVGWAVERLAARLPDEVITVSATTARRLRDELGYRGPIHVVPNGFDPVAVGRAGRAEPDAEVVFIGRLIAEKRVDLLIDAMARLAADGVTVRCRIVGDGPERSALTARTARHDLADRVMFTGTLAGGDEVLATIKAARVLVLPSTREGFGMVVLEANACGVPVITVRHPGNAAAELIEEDVTGWVVEPTVDAVAAAIRRAVEMPGDADRIAAYVGRYAWPAVVAGHGLEAVYAPAAVRA